MRLNRGFANPHGFAPTPLLPRLPASPPPKGHLNTVGDGEDYQPNDDQDETTRRRKDRQRGNWGQWGGRRLRRRRRRKVLRHRHSRGGRGQDRRSRLRRRLGNCRRRLGRGCSRGWHEGRSGCRLRFIGSLRVFRRRRRYRNQARPIRGGAYFHQQTRCTTEKTIRFLGADSARQLDGVRPI